jgi:hypothetical protein
MRRPRSADVRTRATNSHALTRPRPWLRSFTVCVLAASAAGVVPARAGEMDRDPSPAFSVSRAPAGEERVEYDTPGNGEIWARGATYKAGFSAAGTVYAPFLGSRAPRNFPVTFRVESASVGGEEIAFASDVSPERTGDTVSYARGGIVEIYELAPRSVEQIVIVPRLPSRRSGGDLVLRISAESELAGHENPENPGGFEFANELGAVRYGRATAIDDRGARIDAATTLTAGGIEIRVPAEFIAAARFPLVIDPVISSFVLDNTLVDGFEPDIAYSATDDCWLAVYEEVFSASDHDVRYRLLDATGGSIKTGYADMSLSNYWAHPSVAAVTNTFLVVAELGLPSSGARTIIGRCFNATTQDFDGIGSFSISGTGSGFDLIHPKVGGRGGEGTLPYQFAVVWERVFSATDHDIHYRIALPAAIAVGPGPIPIDNTGATIDTAPAISKSNHGGKWSIVFQRQVGAASHDLRAARLNADGTIAAASFSIDTTIFDTFAPSVSSTLTGSDRWLVACQEFNSGWNVTLRALEGTTVIDSVDLSSVESLSGASTHLAQSQLRPVADCDGTSFAVAYVETATGGSGNLDTYVATLALLGNRIHLSEGHKVLGGSFTKEDHVAISSCAATGGAARRYMAIWDDEIGPANQADIEAGLYDGGLYTSFCHPTFDASACPCGNPAGGFGRGCNNSQNTGGAELTMIGTSSLASDTLSLFGTEVKSNALSVFNQGNAVLASSLPFGQGVRCVGGSLKRLYTKTATSTGLVLAPQSGDPSVHARSAALGDVITPGTTRAYYVYYRDPIVLGGCSSASTFNTTQAVQAMWIP